MGIRWADLHKYSLVWVEFGGQKENFDCDDEASYRYGLNLGHEFCYRHMAIVVSNDIRADVIAVVPITTYRDGDERYGTNIVIDIDKFGYMVGNKSTVKVGHIRNIDKKKRVKKIIKPFVSKTLKAKIKESIKSSFE